jgi:hypothetical protein
MFIYAFASILNKYRGLKIADEQERFSDSQCASILKEPCGLASPLDIYYKSIHISVLNTTVEVEKYELNTHEILA